MSFCLTGPCQSDEFHCTQEDLCIDDRLKCDGTRHCDDNLDESDCSCEYMYIVSNANNVELKVKYLHWRYEKRIRNEQNKTKINKKNVDDLLFWEFATLSGINDR